MPRWVLAAAVFLVGSVGGCQGADDSTDGPQAQRRYDLCGEAIPEAELIDFLDGNLVVVAQLDEDGSSKSQAVGDLAVSLVANGIDYGDLTSARPSFSEGAYTLQTRDSELSFRLYYADEFEDAAAGDAIPYNLFDPDSYAQNVEVDLDTSQFPPVVRVDYDPGPLAGMIDGDLRVDEASLSVSVQIRADLVALEVDSLGQYDNAWEVGDSLALRMTTTRLNLGALGGDLDDAGFGFSYDGTRYTAPTGPLDQELFESEFLTVRQDNGNYSWEGEYGARVDKGELTLFQRGWASNAGGNFTEYFCDEARSTRVAVAEHDDSLEGGVFVLEDGTRVEYGLR